MTELSNSRVLTMPKRKIHGQTRANTVWCIGNRLARTAANGGRLHSNRHTIIQALYDQNNKNTAWQQAVSATEKREREQREKEREQTHTHTHTLTN